MLLGGTGCGKSTLAEQLIPMFAKMYPSARILVMDSKPRFRAEWEPTGRKATRRYKHWDHGATLTGSILLQYGANPNDALNAAWPHGRIVVAQTETQAQRGWSVGVLDAFLKQARTGRPQLVYIDETLDFFHSNAVARGSSDAILRAARAGRERGVALLAASQRPKGIPVQLMSEMSKTYLFRLDFTDDIKHMGEMGYPWRTAPPPDEDHTFVFWDKKRRTDTVKMRLSL